MINRAATLVILGVLAASCAAEPEPTPAPSSTSSTTTTLTAITSTTTTTTAAPTTTIPAEIPAGYGLVEIEAQNVRLALPDTWVTIDLTQEGWEELLAEGLEAIPEAAALVDEEAQALITQGGLLVAYDFENQIDEFLTNVNILGLERGPLDDPEVIVPFLNQQLDQIGALDLTVDDVEVPLGEAIRAGYELPPETGFTHTVVQYYVFGPDTVYVVTFSTENIIELEFVFETIMSTFDAIQD